MRVVYGVCHRHTYFDLLMDWDCGHHDEEMGHQRGLSAAVSIYCSVCRDEHFVFRCTPRLPERQYARDRARCRGDIGIRVKPGEYYSADHLELCNPRQTTWTRYFGHGSVLQLEKINVLLDVYGFGSVSYKDLARTLV